MSGTTTSAPSTVGPKAPKFAGKTGFVIPKNKLAGSLVPLFRGKKQGASDVADKESAKQGQRKTKWGPDLTQDADVKQGRALAYQTRVDQITKQLKSGILDVRNDKDSSSAAHYLDHNTSRPQSDKEKLEALELEKREVIGEILKLNSSYKPPPDYKPLLKEARVPIPVKEYPGYNFIGLIFGPGSDTQKRFEKETGAKIQVYGVKAEAGEKVEICPSDGSNAHCAYDELYVQISADTFDKVDEAASLIEKLVTSVLGNLAAVNTSSTDTRVTTNPPSHVMDAPSTSMVSSMIANQSLIPPLVGPQNPSHGQFQYPGNWFPSQSSVSVPPPSGLLASPNPVTPVLNSPSNLSSTSNPSNLSSLFSPRPTPATYNQVQQQPQALPLQQPYRPQTNYLGHGGPPTGHQMPVPQPHLDKSNMFFPSPYTSSQNPPAHPSARPFFSPQPQQAPPPRAPHGQQFSGIGSPGWPGGTAGPPASTGSSKIEQMVPPMNPSQGRYPAGVYSGVSPAPPPPSSAMNLISTHPMGSSGNFAPNSSANSFQASAPNSFAAPSSSAPPLLHSGVPSSNSGSFTFQPQLSQSPVPQRGPILSGQHASHNPPSTQILRPPAPQPPSFQMPVLGPTPPFMQGPRSQAGQMLQPQFHATSVPRFGNTSSELIPSRVPANPNAGEFAPRASALYTPRNFSPAPQMRNLDRPFAPPPPSQNQQNFRAPVARPESIMSPGQQLSNRPFALGKTSASPGGQIYDPFSPTS